MTDSTPRTEAGRALVAAMGDDYGVRDIPSSIATSQRMTWLARVLAIEDEMEAQARTEALDVGALDAALEEAVSILTNRGGYGWTDALHVVQKARAILAAKETP